MGSGDRKVLAVAHPGHELMVHGWLERERPTVLVFTDGSGRSGRSRLNFTREAVENAGGFAGGLFGAVRDGDVYAALLEGDKDFFVRWTGELAGEFARIDPSIVAADAYEGCNPIHDIWRVMVNAALRTCGIPSRNLGFALFQPHDRCGLGPLDRDHIHVALDGAALRRKIAAAHRNPELVPEVESFLTGTSKPMLGSVRSLISALDEKLHGSSEEALATECFSAQRSSAVFSEERFYDAYGDQLVEKERYSKAILYREHVLPMEEAIAAAHF